LVDARPLVMRVLRSKQGTPDLKENIPLLGRDVAKVTFVLFVE
jgi:hypothetical protein